MARVPSVSFILGLAAGIISMVVYINYSLSISVIALILSFTIFELYKKYFAGEPDFIMHFDNENLEDAEDFEKLIRDIFEGKANDD
jgi:hypothetical protein